MRKKSHKLFFATLSVSLLVSILFYKKKLDNEHKIQAYNQVAESLFYNNKKSEKVIFDGEELKVKYTTDKELEKYIKKILRRYRSDYSAVVVINNDTGAILASEGYSGVDKKEDHLLPYTGTHPAASIFKIISMANLIESANIDPEQKFEYNGKGSTLYKYQLAKKTRKTWKREITLEKAFSESNNVVLGKASIHHSSGESLYKTANKFFFNQSLMSRLGLSKSFFQVPESQYNLAELSSGFNRKTTLSPIHAAFIANVVGNGGLAFRPHIISSIKDSKNEILYKQIKKEQYQVLEKETAAQLTQVMRKTIVSGTARSSFRRFNFERFEKIGGKTGTLRGGTPNGQRDWFVMFAKDKGNVGNISIAVMNVNLEKWRVKAAFLAKLITNFYFNRVQTDIVQTKLASLKKANDL